MINSSKEKMKGIKVFNASTKVCENQGSTFDTSASVSDDSFSAGSWTYQSLFLILSLPVAYIVVN